MSTKSNIQEQIQLFQSLFKGREDVFALRWENGNKSGYMPAYFYDPYRYRIHKINGGSFKDFTEKLYLPIKDEQLSKHLTGEHFAGIYPLLQNNTSWFIASDFDKENWQLVLKEILENIESALKDEFTDFTKFKKKGMGTLLCKGRRKKRIGTQKF